VKDDGRADVLRRLNVSRETDDRLDLLVDRLRQWQSRINLIAPSTLSEIWVRHILDSGQLSHLEPEAQHWIDLGSGGGFPGLVVAILGAERPGFRVDLVESNGKKAAFLRQIIREAGLNSRVFAERIEVALCRSDWGVVDVVSARALASLNDLLRLGFPLLKTGTKALFPKGRDVELEMAQASRFWWFQAELIPSWTESSARIVRITGCQPRAEMMDEDT
jgi:16S rRNA (guanine527-N7)-methyltransferase